MVTPELLDYIRQQQEAGVSPDVIRANLKAQGGWSDDNLDQAFLAATVPVRSPMPQGIAPTVTTPAPVTTTEPTISPSKLIPNPKVFNENVDDIGVGTHDYIWKYHRTTYLTTLILSIAASVALLFLTIIYGEQLFAPAAIDPRIFVLCIIPLTIPAAVYASYKSKVEALFSQQLAASLGFTYTPTGDVNSLSGDILTNGDCKITNVISGSYEGSPIRIFTFARLVRQGRSSTWRYATVLEWTTTITLPDMVLSPTKAQYGSSTDVAFDVTPAGYKILSLEGNFDTYFKLYILEGSQIDALQLFQPDFMAELMDTYSSFGLEFASNKIYVYPRKLITNKTDFLSVLTLAERIHDKILPTLQEMQAGESLQNTAATAG